DTFASIYTQGLLGEQYIGLSPGGSQEFMHPGDELTHTQSALVLEQLIGQYMFKKAGEDAAK
ncbi:MAG: outer membrane lipid asymmetry maintenance protein MlaD, partial [Chromatiaceae bacterium]